MEVIAVEQPYLGQEYAGPELVELSTPVDWDSWRYSRFALPWLVWCFLWLIALFCLTFWQQAGNIKNLRDGVPRMISLQSTHDDNHEAGLPIGLRSIRIAGAWFCFLGIALTLVVFFARPAQKTRTALNFFYAVLLIIGCVLAWISFGIGLGSYRDLQRCVPNRRYTFQRCLNHEAYATVEVCLDACVGITSIIAALLLAYNTKANHWKLAARDWEEAQQDSLETVKERTPGEMVQRNVGYVRKWLTGIALLVCLAFVAAWMVFLVLLHEDREKQWLMGPRGRGDWTQRQDSIFDFEHAGWPVKDTRLRYSVVAVGIVTILFNFLPFRSKTIAYVFGGLYFLTAVMAIIAFAIDFHEADRARQLPCINTPDNLQQICTQDPFIATIALDFIVCVFLLIYLIVEYGIMQKRQCQHCDRAYGMQDLIKHETCECPARPVRCDVCAKAMTFNQFDKHKEYCSVDHVRCTNCGTMIAKWGVKAHQEECARWPVQCTMCADSFQRCDMPHHVMVCPNRPTSCDACGETFRKRDLEAHRAVCHEVLVMCDQCEDHMQRFRLSQHQQQDCPKRLVRCDRCDAEVHFFRFSRHECL
jgi:hypothetical protein